MTVCLLIKIFTSGRFQDMAQKVVGAKTFNFKHQCLENIGEEIILRVARNLIVVNFAVMFKRFRNQSGAVSNGHCWILAATYLIRK